MDDLIKQLEAATAQDEKRCVTAALEYAGRRGLISADAVHRGWDLASVGAWLEVAMLLVPDGWTAWELRSRGNKTRFSADLSRLTECDAGEDSANGSGPTPALALCIAALRAHEALQPVA